jgi:hypothetical protein
LSISFGGVAETTGGAFSGTDGAGVTAGVSLEAAFESVASQHESQQDQDLQQDQPHRGWQQDPAQQGE